MIVVDILLEIAFCVRTKRKGSNYLVGREGNMYRTNVSCFEFCETI